MATEAHLPNQVSSVSKTTPVENYCLLDNSTHLAKRAWVVNCIKDRAKGSQNHEKRKSVFCSRNQVSATVWYFLLRSLMKAKEPLNVTGAAREVYEDKKLPIVYTKCEKQKKKISGNQFELLKFRVMRTEKVPRKELSFRENMKRKSVCGGRGLKRCLCRVNCLSKRCVRFKQRHNCNCAHARMSLVRTTIDSFLLFIYLFILVFLLSTFRFCYVFCLLFISYEFCGSVLCV